jgi:hypothetical protein
MKSSGEDFNGLAATKIQRNVGHLFGLQPVFSTHQQLRNAAGAARQYGACFP